MQKPFNQSICFFHKTLPTSPPHICHSRFIHLPKSNLFLQERAQDYNHINQQVYYELLYLFFKEQGETFEQLSFAKIRHHMEKTMKRRLSSELTEVKELQAACLHLPKRLSAKNTRDKKTPIRIHNITSLYGNKTNKASHMALHFISNHPATQVILRCDLIQKAMQSISNCHANQYELNSLMKIVAQDTLKNYILH